MGTIGPLRTSRPHQKVVPPPPGEAVKAVTDQSGDTAIQLMTILCAAGHAKAIERLLEGEGGDGGCDLVLVSAGGTDQPRTKALQVLVMNSSIMRLLSLHSKR